MPCEPADVARYYDQTLRHYRFLWDMDRSQALHYGFWGPGVRSLREALAHENQVLADRLRLGPDARLLDAGCGVGGSSLYLAQRFGCEVTGITLSAEQLRLCETNAREAGLEKQLQFRLMDFQKTDFEDASFDAVWFVESFCHSPDKAALLREMHRVLKPGGQLLIADYFRRGSDSEGDQRLLQEWLSGWAVHGLESPDWMLEAAAAAGFEGSRLDDVTPLIAPSARRLYHASFLARLVIAGRRLRGIRKPVSEGNVRAAHRQYLAFRRRVVHYGIFEAFKPR
ncbi:MAG TPA: methyltransferase domain-containing protein [Solimonas sp.]|nr:methyltransferase domain-containing protein [Solimonas sp.]